MRLAKISPGRSSTGSRFTVAVAAPVIMLVAPGPIEEVQAKVPNRFLALAKAVAACTIQGLAKAGHIAVPENTDNSIDQTMLNAIPRNVLVLQEFDDGGSH